MKTTEEKLNLIFKGCDKIVDEFKFNNIDAYEEARYDLAREILRVINDD